MREEVGRLRWQFRHFPQPRSRGLKIPKRLTGIVQKRHDQRRRNRSIVLKTKTGIFKIYFVELPKDVQERFHYKPATPIRVQAERTPIKVEKKR